MRSTELTSTFTHPVGTISGDHHETKPFRNATRFGSHAPVPYDHVTISNNQRGWTSPSKQPRQKTTALLTTTTAKSADSTNTQPVHQKSFSLPAFRRYTLYFYVPQTDFRPHEFLRLLISRNHTFPRGPDTLQKTTTPQLHQLEDTSSLHVSTNVPGTFADTIALAKSHGTSSNHTPPIKYTIPATSNIMYSSTKCIHACNQRTYGSQSVHHTKPGNVRCTSNSRPLPSTIGELRTER